LPVKFNISGAIKTDSAKQSFKPNAWPKFSAMSENSKLIQRHVSPLISGLKSVSILQIPNLKIAVSISFCSHTHTYDYGTKD
jgi:hypothetical protein